LLVVNTQPFELVYTLVPHVRLGWVLEPHVVQINSLGKYTLTHQRIYSKTADYFKKKISAHDMKVIGILDEINDDFIFKLFYTEGKKKIRTSEFFDKYCSEELVNEKIRPYLDLKLNKAFNLLRGRTIFKMGNDNNPTSVHLNVSKEKASVLFHFRRNEEGTRYFPTIKYKEERIEFMYKGASIITNQPAWMLLENNLIDFEKEVDGRKLTPFLNKRYIQIARTGEENYFNRFVTHLIEKYDVYAEGFKIVTERNDGAASIQVQPFQDSDNISLKLHFRYGKAEFDYGSEQQISAVLERNGDDYTFKRVRRNRNWEDEKKGVIEALGIHGLSGPYFTLKHEPKMLFQQQQLIPLEATNKYEFLEWLNDHANELKEAGIQIEQSPEFNKFFIGKREIKLEVKEQKDWFDIKAVVTFGEFTFPFIALKENILKGKREFLLPNGLVAVIPEEWFGNLAGILAFSASDDEIRLEKHHVGLISELTNDGGKYLRISDKLERIKNYGQIRDMELPGNFHGLLRPYQKAGFDWFYFLKENRFGGCLADDMGLGKTIQTLALLQKEKELYQLTLKNHPGEMIHPVVITKEAPQLDLFVPDTNAPEVPHAPVVPEIPQQESNQVPESLRTFIRTSLIIVPNSLVYNWFQEAAKFTPDLKVLIYTGINREKNPAMFGLYDLVISTYGTVRVDIDILKEYRFNYIILDESQSIKNPNSLSSRAVKQLKSSFKLVLTGTPIENSVQELWSQFSFINPGLVGSLPAFTEQFVTPIEKGKDVYKLQQLKAVIKPFLLRRTKDQVAKDLPPKIEQVKFCNMTEEQSEAYEKVKSYFRNEIIKSIQEVGLNRSQMALLQGLTRLRQIANHPKLTNPEYEGQAGKFDEIVAMSETARLEGHKVLLFSQFVKQLEIYKAYFEEKNWMYCYLDGSMGNEDRQKEVKRFQEDDSVPFFLISLKAGGVGLNLTSADYVFIIDPWWNPAVEQQAVDRTHRIGQDKTVFNYKFITKDTVEEKILALQQRKKELAGSIITTEEGFIKNINVDEILELLS